MYIADYGNVLLERCYQLVDIEIISCSSIGRKINEVLCHIYEKSILKLTYVIRFENGILGNET